MKERLVICNEEDTDGRARVKQSFRRLLRPIRIFCAQGPAYTDSAYRPLVFAERNWLTGRRLWTWA